VPQQSHTGTGSAAPVGTGEREVASGECAISIADAAGHFWRTIWNHPANDEVKSVRGSPHVLLAGDRLHVPPIVIKEEDGATEQRHCFRRKGIPITFEIVVKENGKPLAGERYIIVIEGRMDSGTIPSDGKVTVKMFPSDRTGELRVGEGENVRTFPLGIGELDPAHSRTGAEARLANLGRIGDCPDNEDFAAAIRKFQKDNDLERTGELNDATASKLAEVHGS